MHECGPQYKYICIYHAFFLWRLEHKKYVVFSVQSNQANHPAEWILTSWNTKSKAKHHSSPARSVKHFWNESTRTQPFKKTSTRSSFNARMLDLLKVHVVPEGLKQLWLWGWPSSSRFILKSHSQALFYLICKSFILLLSPLRNLFMPLGAGSG